MTVSEIEARMADLCASYQQAVVDALQRKTRFALHTGDFRSIGLSGGVANNQTLRQAMGQLAEPRDLQFLAAEPRHTGDNAGMIAFAAWADPAVAASSPEALAIAPGLPLATATWGGEVN